MIIPALTVVLGLAMLPACDAPPAVQTTVAQTAEQVVAELAKRVPTAKPGLVLNTETDQNKLLGRRHSYQSKASFTDSRIHPRDAFDTSEGSSPPAQLHIHALVRAA